MGRRGLIVLGIIALLAGGLGVTRVVTSNDGQDPGGREGGKQTSSDVDGDSGSGGTSGQGEPAASGSTDGGGRADANQHLDLPPDWAFGSYNKVSYDEPRPNGCSLRRGDSCALLFVGEYRVVSYDSAIVRIAAFENGGGEPVAKTDLPIGRGNARFFEQLLYTPGANAVTVQFRVLLLDTAGKVIFGQDPPEPTLAIQD